MSLFACTTALTTSMLLLAGVGTSLVQAEKSKSAEPRIVKVKVHKGGAVSLDGQRVSPDELRDCLKKHKEENGVVWYYRESADPKARETGEAVIKIIIELKLPVRLMELENE